MDEFDLNKDNLFYQLGFSLLMFLAAVVWLSTFLFFLGVPMQPFAVPFAIVISFLFTAYIEKLSLKDSALLAAGMTVIIFTCALASTYVYDFSFDGNTYHKTTIGMIKNGWNPIYQSFENAALTLKIIPDDYDWPIWYDHYPKASWIIGAAFYRLSGNIETGKCMNVIICAAVLFMLLGRLNRYQLFGKKTRIIFAVMAVITPVTLPQMQSYYNDGMMQMLIYASLISLINLSLADERDRCRQDWIVLFAVIHIALNIKYSGLIFMGLYCGGFYFYWWIRDAYAGRKDTLKNLTKATAFYCVTVGSAICFTGSTSYMRNLIHHKNLLYTMLGEDKIEIISPMLPKSYANKPYVVQFFLSLFSRAANISAVSEIVPELKLPFTFSKAEWETGSLFDLRIGAWGLLFSGIFLLCVCAMVPMFLSLYSSKEKCRHVFGIASLIIGITFVQVLFVPGLAWARYFAHLFILPMTVCGFLLHDKSKRICCLAGYIMLIMIVMNVGNFAYYSIDRIDRSQDVRLELDALSTVSKTHQVAVHLNGGAYTQGYLFNLMDAGVNYAVYPDMKDGTTIFNWRINYKVLS